MNRRCLMPSLTALFLLGTVGSISPARAAEAPVDTVRTNLWLARALMADILSDALDSLPADAPGLLLEPSGRHEALDLMQTVAFDLAAKRGLSVYVAPPPATGKKPGQKPAGGAAAPNDTTRADAGGQNDPAAGEPIEGIPSMGAAPYVLVFLLDDVEVEFPRAGRRLGLWRTWIDRECTVSATVMLRDRRDGMILHNDRAVRTFGDRFAAGQLPHITESNYEFNEARIADGGGIQSILEEVVVLGALAGLIAVYFATTAD